MDLATNYLGLRLKNPLVAGASPVSRDLDTVRALEDAGVAAIVLASLFQEEVDHQLAAHAHFAEFGAYSSPEALTYVPARDYTPRHPDAYLEHLRQAAGAVDVPVIASLNGATAGGWIEHARMIEEAGASAIELNVYHVAADPGRSAQQVEDLYVEVLRAVKNTVGIPVSMKLSPYFSSLAHFARRLDKEGVDGLVLFNRFYQPDIDLNELTVVPNLSLSAPHEMRLPLRWIAILDPLIEASLAASTGVYTSHDVLKLLMTGADAVMLVAVLLRHGPSIVADMLHGIEDWLHVNEYLSVHQLQGSMNHRACADPSAFERANYVKALQSYCG
ncbi:MAG: dihydroorotate dehydrogenase-like protein [Planctomycetota bacterium]